MKEIDFKKIGHRIRLGRLAQNLTQDALAELSGLTSNYISHLEHGRTKLSVQSLVNICNALGISTNQILMDSIDDNAVLLNNDLAKIVTQLDSEEVFLASELCRAILNARKFTKNSGNSQ